MVNLDGGSNHPDPVPDYILVGDVVVSIPPTPIVPLTALMAVTASQYLRLEATRLSQLDCLGEVINPGVPQGVTNDILS